MSFATGTHAWTFAAWRSLCKMISACRKVTKLPLNHAGKLRVVSFLKEAIRSIGAVKFPVLWMMWLRRKRGDNAKGDDACVAKG